MYHYAYFNSHFKKYINIIAEFIPQVYEWIRLHTPLPLLCYCIDDFYSLLIWLSGLSYYIQVVFTIQLH